MSDEYFMEQCQITNLEEIEFNNFQLKINNEKEIQLKQKNIDVVDGEFVNGDEFIPNQGAYYNIKNKEFIIEVELGLDFKSKIEKRITRNSTIINI